MFGGLIRSRGSGSSGGSAATSSPAGIPVGIPLGRSFFPLQESRKRCFRPLFPSHLNQIVHGSLVLTGTGLLQHLVCICQVRNPRTNNLP
jgi:hypothetical protein